MDRPNLLGPVRDYRAEIEAWMARARKSVNPSGGYYGNPSGDDLHPHHALFAALDAIETVVKRGSVADHVRIAKAIGLEKGGA